ncbi:MAG: CDP-glucose 4,6-dehydratase [Bryobacteraceae bacterium]|nr:CDP-glucose 4,6-dehydratase [Bryobacteraceae bacterium]
MKHLFNGAFDGITVLLTGHTGFKGSWMSSWLLKMNANLVGFSLPDPPTNPSNYDLCEVRTSLTDVRGDIRDYEAVEEVIRRYRPDLIIHFAAQTTVLASYEDPKITFDTNVGGTVNVLEAVRRTGSVKALLVCATDKVYENKEWVWGYRESDSLGGRDPYSASKAMAELAVNAYRQSFFSKSGSTAIASARAGNVIGGGDFTAHGLIADTMRSILQGEPVRLRRPSSTRPWLFVLEPLSGYLCLAANLLRHGVRHAQEWNFGPWPQDSGVTTMQLVEQLLEIWGVDDGIRIQTPQGTASAGPHEAQELRLNWEKAASYLEWRPVYRLDDALRETVLWFKTFQQKRSIPEVCQITLDRYVSRAEELALPWTR